MNRVSQSIRILAFLALAGLAGGGAGWISYRTALDGLAEQGRADLALAADRLSLQLLRYRELAVVLTSQPELQALLFAEGAGGGFDEARRLVRAMADKTGALSVDLVGRDGQVLASSSAHPRRLGPDAEPLSRALDGALGTGRSILVRPDADGARRIFAFAAPVFGPDGPSLGAVVTRVDVRGIEENWPGNAPAAFFLDENGVVFASNRSELLLTRRGAPDSFPALTASHVSGNEVWRLEGGPYLPRRALHLERDLPTIGLSANVLLDTRPAIGSAALTGAATMALLMVFGAALMIAHQQRRALGIRLAAEAAANARLESRVAQRTLALSQANADLRREVGERREAEAALKRAQDELVQAGKLSALGQMSAGISHELNQPLMAIGSFAENGLAFMERGAPERARANLERISQLAKRMGRIIRNLRAFARQEAGEVTDVDLVAVVADSLDVMAEKIARAGIALDWVSPDKPVMVRGGAVRLQQVLVNLIANAIDAMEDLAPEAPRRIAINLAEQEARVELSVSDSGPGLAQSDRVFDPFYTTKAVGTGDGLGLGLSISYGLVQSFSGTIRAENRPGGGACFTVELVRATQRKAA